MELIKLEGIAYILSYDQGGKHPAGQSQYIDEGVVFVFEDILSGELKEMLDHRSGGKRWLSMMII